MTITYQSLTLPAATVVVLVVDCLFLGFSLVDTCQTMKTVCTNCDIDNAPPDCPSLYSTKTSVSQEFCYNLHDGVKNVTTEYRVDSSECVYRGCFVSAIKYRVNRIITMVTCLSGIVNIIKQIK